jgi:hypothetical protein
LARKDERITRLNKALITNIETSAQAAEVLRPIAGDFAFAVLALGLTRDRLWQYESPPAIQSGRNML